MEKAKQNAKRRRPPRAEQKKAQAPAGPLEFQTEAWQAAYVQRIDATIAALKAANVPVFWVGLPPQRDARQSAAAVYLNELYRTRAERAGIIYVDIWDGFVDEAGRYVLQGPDFEGQIRRLRSGDGIYFTRAGARKLAHYVEREILRSLVARQTPVALPAPEPAVVTPGRGHASARRAGGPADGLDRRRQRAARRRPRRGRPATIRWRPACWCAASRSPRRPGAPTISPGRSSGVTTIREGEPEETPAPAQQATPAPQAPPKAAPQQQPPRPPLRTSTQTPPTQQQPAQPRGRRPARRVPRRSSNNSSRRARPSSRRRSARRRRAQITTMRRARR